MATQLPIKNECAGRATNGFCTPKEDNTVQKMKVPPKHVIPIVFLPGIMGSNLRMSAARQKLLGKSNNIAWRPDRPLEAASLVTASAARRQLQLDPRHTEVDTYVAGGPTGNSKETSEDRHNIGAIHVYLDVDGASPLLADDPPGIPDRKTKQQKARERGWGEIYFSSYQKLLESCEKYLNSGFIGSFWKSVIDHDPTEWSATVSPPLRPLTTDEFRHATQGRIFPVHAMGYNWLQGNEESAISIKNRILQLIASYKGGGYICEKVILVTHSMGGLVARAMIHPSIGDASHLVLGVVHGVMPALGAPAAYKRMRCGFEQGMLGLSITAKVLGDNGSKVTAVLGNSLGGLQLLPSKAYGNGWLQVRRNKVLFDSFPKNGDPYSEIYKLQTSWYGLLREPWLNSADKQGGGVRKTNSLLDEARKFHETIDGYYHPLSYAHYGADPQQPSWETVCWNLGQDFAGSDWHNLNIVSDDEQGKLNLSTAPKSKPQLSGTARLGASSGSGDQTVPTRSSEDQLLRGRFKGIFRQTNYEHQASFQDTHALRSTLYSIVRIAAEMQWGTR